jgi:bacteriocin-like protein
MDTNIGISELSIDEMEAVSGGGAISLTTSTVVVPHIPRAKDLLSPEQIAKVLSMFGSFNPPVPRG